MRRAIILIFLFVSISLTAQSRYALLIGIGDYPAKFGWNKIHGDNDVSIIKTLLLEQGFIAENITVLTNADATKSGILSAMDMLRLKAQKGDVVYIQFSGHGQQVTDMNGDEEDHFDEEWIPYDARKQYVAGEYEGENHILDDDLNAFLNGLRSKVGTQGKIVLVADACHSGSGSRGLGNDEEEFVRGTDEKFIIPGGGANVVRKEAPVYWLHVAACKPYQTNYEYKTGDGTFYGSLSYVISTGNIDLVTSDYRDVINQWRKALVEITRYPQDMDDEGRPSRKSNMMF